MVFQNDWLDSSKYQNKSQSVQLEEQYNNDGLRNPLLWRITDKVLKNDERSDIIVPLSLLSTLSVILHNNGFLKPSLLYISSTAE